MRVVSSGRKPLAAQVGLRICEGLTLGGLLLTLVAVKYTTGLSFTMFNSIGVPMMLLSIVIFIYLLIDDMRKRYSLFSVEAFEAGEVIINQGDPADRAYFVQKGEIEIVREERGTRTRVATLGPGQYFGEIALLRPNVRRTATVCALTDVELLVLGKENFYRLLQAIPSLHEQLLSRSTERTTDEMQPKEQPGGSVGEQRQ